MTNLWVGAIVLVPLLISGTAYADGVDGQIGTILKADEIDSRTVKVGAFAVVIHGQGKRNHVSGMWEQLETARGYIRTIDWEKRWLILTMKRERPPQSIALDRIQTLVLIKAPSLKGEVQASRPVPGEVEGRTVVPFSGKSADRENTLIRRDPARTEGADAAEQPGQPQLPPGLGSFTRKDSLKMGTSNRIASKLGSGALLGSFCGLTFAFLTPGATAGDVLGLNEIHSIVYNWLLGYTIGTVVGVTAVDPYDRPIMSLAGSVVGAALGTIPGDVLYGGNSALWPLFICPLVGATIGSELWRDSPKESRFTIDLRPDFNGCPSAVVALHF